MKQMEVHEKQIGQNTFYIRPFPAISAAVISGTLTSILGPVIGELGPIIDSALSGKGSIEDVKLEDIEIGSALPAIGAALSHLDGEQIESLIRKLLIDSGNVSVSGPDTQNSTVLLSLDVLNEVFCGELQDMIELCLAVIKVNYSGFFTKLLTRYGSQLETTGKKAKSQSGAGSTLTASLT